MTDVEVTRDTLFGGRLKLTQFSRGHRAGTDAVLLAAFATPTGGLIVDVGAGVGTVGLALAMSNPEARVCLLERAPEVAALARDNVIDNALDGRVGVVETDVLGAFPRRNAGVRNESADLVVTNPPFYDAGTSRSSPDALKRSAHVVDGSLDAWLRACLTIVRPGGTLCIVHRAERLGTILSALEGRSGGTTVRTVHPKAEAPASRVLVRATKGSRAPLSVLPPLVLHDASGAFTREAAELHAGDWLDTDRATADQSQTCANEG